MTEQECEDFLMECSKHGPDKTFNSFGRKVWVTRAAFEIDSVYGMRQTFELSCGSTIVFTKKRGEYK
jgi:hypothetical protein